jgi:site-specific DNA-methyltransferase (adenine-specific)
MIKHELFNCDCVEFLENDTRGLDTIFADPPDNIGLNYREYRDRKPEEEYVNWLETCLDMFMRKSQTLWFSFNARWTFAVGNIFYKLLKHYDAWEAKPCVQVFTFGQHNHNDLGNNHRPLWRIRRKDAPLFPDAVRVPSWRQEHGDKRADPRGRVPGDVFDFTRVTGNSEQRRAWHPTQLNEGLVERCLKLTTPPDGTVLDPFGGTGTTLRVCKRLELPCVIVELDQTYCEKIFEEHRQGDLARGSLEFTKPS